MNDNVFGLLKNKYVHAVPVPFLGHVPICHYKLDIVYASLISFGEQLNGASIIVCFKINLFVFFVLLTLGMAWKKKQLKICSPAE